MDMNKKIKVITKEEHIRILKELAAAIACGERDFSREEWEYIHEVLMASAMRLEFGE